MVGMRAPVTAHCLVIPIRCSALGVIARASLGLPIAPDLHVFSATAILGTRLFRLLGRLLRLNWNCLGLCSSSHSAAGERGNQGGS